MKLTKVMFAIAVFAIGQVAFAGKVVIFDAQQAIMQTSMAKQRMEALQKNPEYAKLRAELDGYQADLSALAKEAESKGLTWSAEQQAEHRKKVEFIQADRQLVIQKLQKENDDLVKGLLEEGQKMIPAVLEQLVKSDEIDVILRKEATFFASPAVDITAKVIAELNKASSK